MELIPIDMNKGKKKILILFLHDSTGELFVALPIIWFLKKYMDIEVHFVSKYSDILKRINVSERYIQIMKEIGTFHFGSYRNITLLIKLFFSNNIIVQMSCDMGARRIDRIYYSLLKKSTMVFFTHAYMLHSLNNLKNIAINNALELSVKNNLISAYGTKSDYLLNSSKESNYFVKMGWASESLHAIGAFGYSEEWLKFLFKVNTLKKEKNKHLTIFVPLRDLHKNYLTEANYKYQINSLAKIFKKFSSYQFIVKLHPRQEPREVKEIFGIYNNVSFSNDSPFELALKSDLTMGFWSSTSTDSVSVGTPAVEFHKHEIPHPQLIHEDNKLISLNEHLGLCEGFDDAKLLEVFLRELDNDKLQMMHKRQHQNLTNIYDLNGNYKQNLQNIFYLLFSKASRAHEEQKIEKSFFKLFKKLLVKIVPILK